MSTYRHHWQHLPYPAIIKVMSFLPEHDRHCAANVLRHWRNALWDPILWRKKEFKLRPFVFVPRPYPHKDIRDALNHGHSLRHIKLDLQPPGEGSQEFYSIGVAMLLCILTNKECQLSSLNVNNLYLSKHWTDEISRKRIACALTAFIRGQRQLKSVNLMNAEMKPYEASQLLRALTNVSSHCIKHLEIRGLACQLASNITPVDNTFLGNLPALRTLGLDDNLVTEDVLLRLVRNSPHLTSICLYWNFVISRHISEIPPKIWSGITRMRPALKVDLEYAVGPVTKLLHTRIPLRKLVLRDVWNIELPHSMFVIDMLFNSTLEEIHFYFNRSSDPDVGSRASVFLTSCQLLTVFKFRGPVTKLTDVASFAIALENRMAAGPQFAKLHIFEISAITRHKYMKTALRNFAAKYRPKLVEAGTSFVLTYEH